VLIQIDGISRKQLEVAIEGGRLPFLSKLIARKHFTLETFYSGIPSTTPAVQAEIFYGVKAAVPAFQFLRRSSGKEYRMYEADSAADIERELAASGEPPLLEGGHGYSNIFRGGAQSSHYCSKDFSVQEILARLHPFKLLVLCMAYSPKIIRMVLLAFLEIGLALVDAVRGLYERENFLKEIEFVPARVAVCVVLREAIRLRVLLDIERGVKLIHANFLGYDEQAHRRGPDSAFAHWTLKGIDRAIGDIYHASHQSRYRDYELMIYSDHGQERVEPYTNRYGRDLSDALQAVFESGPLSGASIWIRKMPRMLGSSLDRCRVMFGMRSANGSSEAGPDPENEIVVTAMGPLAHAYLPRKLSADEMDLHAVRMVSGAGVPLVLIPGEHGEVKAFNARGHWFLPRHATEVLGEGHPFLDEVITDLLRLCRHKDSGDFILSGWDPFHPPLSFAMENGAHGGPGDQETLGFLLIPDRIRRWHVSHLEGTRKRVRGVDLRKIVLHYLRRDDERVERVAVLSGEEDKASLRVMTYNIHSCVGMDGKVRPERVARVINHCDPDIVAVQEVDCHRPRSGGHDQAKVIADHLRMSHVFEAMFEEEKERYGIAIFSKYPFEIIRSGYLTPPKGWREGRGAIWLKFVDERFKVLHFINTHFGLGWIERNQQVSELLGSQWLGSIPDHEPVVLCGDFNSGPRSEVFRRLRERLNDAQQSLTGVRKPRATFTASNPILRIDHVFMSDHFQVESVDLPETPNARIASDHLPVCVEIKRREES
jgi:endonuclease/exonuclease/phosphatase family metal-dependent hydrolase